MITTNKQENQKQEEKKIKRSRIEDGKWMSDVGKWKRNNGVLEEWRETNFEWVAAFSRNSIMQILSLEY
jgi:hypothetical protein